MEICQEKDTYDWLLGGDPALSFLVKKDLLDENDVELNNLVLQKGWIKTILDHQKENGHWGDGFYRPKWICSHYILLILKYFQIPKEISTIRNLLINNMEQIKAQDGGINFWGKIKNSDACVNGMFLNYASYFLNDPFIMNFLVDYIIKSQMKDGGWNCRFKHGAVHSSFHTTLSILEGLAEYRRAGGDYQLGKIVEMENEAREFLLKHFLYQSHRTGEPADYKMTLFSFPPHWHYDIMKSLEYFADQKIPYDARLQPALDLLNDKRNADGTWSLQNRHNGRMFFQFEKIGKPSRINTYRALKILRHYSQ